MNLKSRNEKTIAKVRWLIWLYFWLLIFEGALRKWAFPSLSNPLLIVRDPVLLLIYILAFRARVFPKNVWVISLAVISFLAVALSFVVLFPYIPPLQIALVSGFGFRSDYLHLPLIFLLPRVLRGADVKRFGWWTLVVLVPMAVLMVAQFRAAPDAFLNRTAGGEGEMMTSALGKVRTAATFSFVVGVAAYFALSTAFLIWAALRRDVFKNWLLFAGGTALAIGAAVSGSRLVIGSCAVVIASLVIIFFVRRDAINRFGQTLIFTLIFGLIIAQTPIFKEGFNVLSTRFNEVAEATEKSVGAGLVERVMNDFGDGLYVLTKAPFLGYGLGIGTNAGAKFLTGQMVFLLSEGEWSRVFLENGPVLGLAYVLCRIGIAITTGFLCLRSAKAGNVLPLLIFSSTALPLINGQFGQPTVLGFAVFTTGLALAARNLESVAPAEVEAERPMAGSTLRPVRGRSAYSARLHDTPRNGNGANGHGIDHPRGS